MKADEISVFRAGRTDYATPADLQGRCFDTARGIKSRATLAADGVAALFLEVAADNTAGRALYDAAGFSKVGRRADYYRRANAAPAAALVLRRDIRLCGDA